MVTKKVEENNTREVKNGLKKANFCRGNGNFLGIEQRHQGLKY